MINDLFSKGGLSLDRLRGFMQMAEAGSIAKAAPGKPNRQSQISRQIRELEQFFGTELTRRKGKTLSLSIAGERLALLIREQLQDLEDFRKEQAGLPKSFVIGAGASVIEWLLVPALPAISRHLGGATLLTESHRSRSLGDAVRDGRVDLAIIRQDAVPTGANTALVMKMRFHLCIPRALLKRGATERDAASPALWQTLAFAAGRDGGQTDTAVREAMQSAGVDFRPRFECGSMLQVRQLVELGACAGILPTLGIRGLDEKKVLITPFAPLRDFGRALVLHWNPRQMRRRGLETSDLKKLAAIIADQLKA
ncbi:MAG: LysR family transcriptional regulator [Prosthecobacter sp.]|jgi:DNA-binding transcriptional LysR family regulator|uniref:LysR family transcriptional regulator n=1 Tax=Prosthecobacter sp. TaxID=1965333 RepID=UPI0019F32CA9|nr:LysR family transcriptional regulator [Prosthecobacter sp.]MBE2286182.1 LysR family transcriptional regulator [Prosthecobacter sp.]